VAQLNFRSQLRKDFGVAFLSGVARIRFAERLPRVQVKVADRGN
jgi:hypothetical protein